MVVSSSLQYIDPLSAKCSTYVYTTPAVPTSQPQQPHMKSTDYKEHHTHTPPHPPLLPSALSPADEARVIRIQTLVRSRHARKRCEARAGELYRKCLDALSGFEYYYNVRTGSSSWLKPLLLGGSDAAWITNETTAPATATRLSDVRATTSTATGVAAIPDAPLQPQLAESDPFASLKLRTEPSKKTAVVTAQYRERVNEDVAFQQQCAQEKLALTKKHRRKIARAMQRWDRQLLEDKQRRREERLEQLQSANQQVLQELYDGRRVRSAGVRVAIRVVPQSRRRAAHACVLRLSCALLSVDGRCTLQKQNVETLREAAMRGHVDRVRELLTSGFGANAESVRCEQV